jgi:MFS family permease
VEYLWIVEMIEANKYRPFAIKYGRRPVYLLSNFLMGMACIWLAICAEKTYTPFIIGRAFLGLFEAPIEAIVPSTVTDIFFLHERGEKVSVYGLAVLGGNEIGPLVSAYIIQSLNIRWAFFVIAISIFVNQITLFFYLPETKFNGPRPQIMIAKDSTEALEKPEKDTLDKPSSDHHEIAIETGSSPPIAKRSYLKSLGLFTDTDHTVSLRKTFLRPFVLITYPTVIWSSIIYGLALGWNVVLGATVAQLFAPP